MGSVIASYKYLKQFFPPDFIEFVQEGGFLHRLLLEQHPKFDVWRKQVDDCLELAYRYNLVDADFEGRLKKGDWESWEATINELKVAKLIEEQLGIGCLNWRPQGQERKVGEFEIVLNEPEAKLFVEIKTILPRDLENLEQRVSDKIRHCINKLPFPFVLSITLKNAGTIENFRQNDLKKFLTKELGSINTIDNETLHTLPDYRDDKTGLHLAEISAYPSKKEYCDIGFLHFNPRWGGGSDYIRHSLDKAREKKPKSSFLVILCPSPTYLVDELDALNAWLGTEKMVITFDNEGKAISDEMVRAPDGFFKCTEISAFGIYTEELEKGKVEGSLKIYHNPLASIPIDTSVFKRAGIKQLIKKNDTEMIWIEGA